MPSVNLRPRTREDDPALLDIYLQYEDVFRFGLDGWRFHMDERVRPDGKHPVMGVAEADGQIVGDWYVEPHYGGADGVFFAAVEVDRHQRHQGYGSALWEDAERHLVDRGVAKAYVSISVELEESQRFARQRGLSRTGRVERFSRLVLKNANLSGYEGIEELMVAQGVTIRPVSELDSSDDSFLRDLHGAVMSMLRDIPRSEEHWEPNPFEVWRQNFLKEPELIPEAFFLAIKEDHVVGLARLIKNGESTLGNGLTGVIPSARHQGIARALKKRTISWAIENGYTEIVTANDTKNARMLSINIPLGYEALPAREEWLKEYGQPGARA